MTQKPDQNQRAKEVGNCVATLREAMYVFPHQRVGQMISNAVTTFRLKHPELWNTDDTYNMPDDLFALAIREYMGNYGTKVEDLKST